MTKNKLADSNKFFLKNLAAFFTYVNSKQVLPMVILLGGGYIFTLLPSILGGIAFFILYALAYKLAVDVLIETANGNMLPGDYQSSFEAKNILIKFILVGLIQIGLLIWLRFFIQDPLLIIAYIIVSTFVTPAIFMVLSITNSLTSALNPIIIIKLIKPWFFTYLVFVGFWLIIEILQTYVTEPLSAILPSVFGGIITHFIKFYMLILNFHIMGFLIYQKRESFGFEAKTDDIPIINTATENPVYARIKSLIAIGNSHQARTIIDELLKDGDNSQELQKINTLLLGINTANDKALTKAEKIHQLISNNEPGNAFQIYQQMVLDEEKYIEVEAEDVTSLVQSAYQAQKYSQVISLLKFFHNKHPNHDDIVPNYFLIVQIFYRNNETKEQAKTMLEKLIKKHPNHQLIPQLKSWLKGIELLKR